MKPKGSMVIIGISSDIGSAIAKQYLSLGWQVSGTFRTKSKETIALEQQGARLIQGDLSTGSKAGILTKKLLKKVPVWDVLVLCPATLKPVGPFSKIKFKEWSNSIDINFKHQAEIVHALLPNRNQAKKYPTVIAFSGGGTNSAPLNSSAYTVSKIATIKLFEILDREMHDVKFVTVGPGWVKTKIHKETLRAGAIAGDNLKSTKERFAKNDFGPMDRVVACIEWVVQAPKQTIGGRDINVVYDGWNDKEFTKKLAKHRDMLKIRKI